MHRALIALLLLLLPAAAVAAPVVVWLQPEPPEDRTMRRVTGSIGEATHLAEVDLAHPPQPSTRADDQRYDQLRTAMIEARNIWQDFDVEYGIAEALEEALAPIDVLRNRRDLQEMVDARLLQGAAVARAFRPEDFRAVDEAAPFRATIPGARINRPWLLAIALDPDREHTPGDLGDGATFAEFQALRDRIAALPDGALDLSRLPEGATVVVNGRPVDEDATEIELRPGLHHLHLLRDGVISGRQEVEVEAGLTTAVVSPIDPSVVARAGARLAGGSVEGFPEAIDASLRDIDAHTDGEMYVGVVQNGRVHLEVWGREIEAERRPLVTVLATGEVGGGVVVSSLFDGSGGSVVTAPGAIGGLGLEIGISNAALIGGFDLAFTPGETITHGDAEETANVVTSVLPQPWGGVGLYLLRPVETQATLLLAGTLGWNGPAHTAVGGRVTLGIPIDDVGTWFRLTVGGSSAARSNWDRGSDETPMHVGFLRFGFGTRF